MTNNRVYQVSYYGNQIRWHDPYYNMYLMFIMLQKIILWNYINERLTGEYNIFLDDNQYTCLCLIHNIYSYIYL